MKTIKLYESILNEKFVGAKKGTEYHDDEYTEIFKNPTSKEWKEVVPNCKIIIDSNGDLYAFSSSRGKNYSFIHSQMINFLEENGLLKVNPNKDIYTQLITAERKGNSNNICLSSDDYLDRHLIKWGSFFDSVYKLAKEKNPSLTFKKEIY